MRLLMTTDAVGGVWHYATTLAGALADHGIVVTLAVLGPPPTAAALASVPLGVRVIDTGLALDWLADADATIAAGHAIAALAVAECADVVHLNSPTLAARASFAQPVVAVAHGCVATWWDAAQGGALPPEFGWHQALMRDGLVASDRVIAPTAAYAATVQRRYALSTLPATVHNGRTSPAIMAATTQSDAFTAGRLWDAVKQAALLDRVAARIAVPFAAAGPVAGPQGERATLTQLDCLGTLDDAALTARLAARPIFVSAARFEPFGLAVLEAAGAGCPLVLADIVTARELWDGAATFVGVDDEAGFAAAITALAGDADARGAAGAAARARAARYSVGAMASAMAGHYAALGQRRVAA